MDKQYFYFEHLKNCILKQKENELKQNGKSDIEPLNYSKMIESWYSQLIEKINGFPPEYYVKSLYIVRNTNQDILNVWYDYCKTDEWTQHILLNIYVKY